MSRAQITHDIHHLAARDRRGVLDTAESLHLERLLRLERKVSREARQGMPPAARLAVPRAPIADRLDAAIARMRREGLAVRAFYLTGRDHLELLVSDAACSSGNGDVHFAGVPVRLIGGSGTRSIAYSTHGIARVIRRHV